jgi:hypothetical protein
MPLAWMSEETSKTVWFAVSFALVVVFVQTLVTGLPQTRMHRSVLAGWTVVVLAKFFVRELSLGQTNALLGVLLLPSIVGASRHPRLAGALAGAAVFVKPYAIVLLPWLMLTQAPSATVAWVGALAIGLVLPVAVYGWTTNLHLLRDWYRTVADTTAPNLLHPDNVSLASMFAKWIGAGTAASVLAVVTGLALVALAAWVALRRTRVSNPAYLECGLLMLLIPLLSPQGWDYVLLLAAPVVIMAIDRWSAMSLPLQIAAVAVGVVFATPLRLFVDVDTYNLVMATAFVSVAAVMLVIVAVDLRRRMLA